MGSEKTKPATSLGSAATRVPAEKPQTHVRLAARDLKRSLLTERTQAKADVKVSKPSTAFSLHILFHLRTLWLFTRADIPTAIFPMTLFGLACALSGSVLTGAPGPSVLTILARLPVVILWNWINVLIFSIANQRQPESIEEDAINKPWRPLPSGRISSDQAKRLQLLVIPTVFVADLFLGGIEEAVGVMVLTWMYNELGGSEEALLRNLLNMLGYTCHAAASMRIACGLGASTLDPAVYKWLAVLGGVMFTTIQVQDLKDQEGDRSRGRATLPLVLGDGPARLSVILPVIAWSVLCPALWYLDAVGFTVPVALGCYLAANIATRRSVQDDKRSFKIWSFWLGSLYFLPMLKHYGV